MSVVLLIAGLVILIAVILVAAGRGGELPAERADYAPLDLGPASATDVALLRPPANAWGYNMQATDEAMAQVAESIRERDIRIVALEQLVTDLTREPAPPPLTSPYVGARRRALPEGVTPVQQPGTTPAAAAPLAPLTPQAAEEPSAGDRAPGRDHVVGGDGLVTGVRPPGGAGLGRRRDPPRPPGLARGERRARGRARGRSPAIARRGPRSGGAAGAVP